MITSTAPGAVAASVVTIGAYDGVHLGHQALIGKVHALAQARGLRTVVITFDRHPATVVRPESAPKLLCDLDQKLELLAATGIDATYVIKFDEQRATETAVEFIEEVLVACLDARSVVVGEDFHFGHQRGGTVELLKEQGRVHGFTVEGIPLVAVDGSPANGAPNVSSTAVRDRLAAGEVQEAATLLGRLHEVRGVVEHGDKRGRDLGFPTANVTVPAEIALPADGIYAGWTELANGETFATALSIGHRPTFYDRPRGAPLLECHLLDFSGDLYDRAVKVRFVARLRGEVKFDDVDDLIAQMADDCDRTRALLSSGEAEAR